MKPRDLITAAFGQHNIFVAKEFVFRSIGPNLGKSLSTVIGLGPLPEAASTKILFIHVPRTAGSSVSVGLYGRKVSHHTASYFRAIDPALFDRCFRFSFVRNPWDRLVSAYHLLKAGGSDVVQVWDPHKYVKLKQLDFDEFVHDWLWPRRFRMRRFDPALWPQSYFTHSDSGELLLNYIGRWEHFDAELETLKKKGVFIKNMKINRSAARKSSDYREYYSDSHTIELVREIYDRDIEHFGYSF